MKNLAIHRAVVAVCASVAATSAVAGGGVAQVERPVAVDRTPGAPFAAGFTGPRLGLNVGMGGTNYAIGAEAAVSGLGRGALELPDLGGTGPLASIEAGYDVALTQSVVAGVQVDYARTDIENSTSFSLSDGAGGTFAGDYAIRPEHAVTGSARIGYLPSRSTMIYGMLGYTRASFEGRFSATENGTQVISDSYDFSEDGWVIGAGVETLLSDNLSFKMEYRYTDFGSRNLFNIEDPNSSDFIRADMETSMQTVTAGISYRF